MPLHGKVFWAMSFFLLGTLLASILAPLSQAVWISFGMCTLAIISLLLFDRSELALLALALFIGSGHFQLITASENRIQVPFDRVVTFNAFVEESIPQGRSQRVDVLVASSSAKIRLTADRYPELRYGDVISVQGKVQPLKDKSKNYYLKEGISGTLSFPEVSIVARDQGAVWKTILFRLRSKVIATFESLLPSEQAQFLSGITLGRSVGFSKEFEEKLKITGTTHLVALSGYNVTIIASSIAALLGLWFSRRTTFIGSTLAIVAFVIMTGAQASVVRAAIMGIILLVAQHSGRILVMKNAIVAAAFGMTLANPRVLLFDIGFQLSFVALLGITYLSPALQAFFRSGKQSGFLAWRKNLYTTLGAQLAVLPILLSSFGFVSLLSIIPNVLILTFIPYTMLGGVILFGVSLISHYLAFLLSFAERILIGYELGVINFFSKFQVGVEMESVALIWSIIYFAALGGFIMYTKRRYDAYTI